MFEGQMRIAFIVEALTVAGISAARIVLIDCDDAIRSARLSVDRGQPELANVNMMRWAQYLREEATRGNYEILNTGVKSFNECVELLKSYLRTGSHGC